ncbi:uncharacterized protein J8A68_003784 [[Candida] subhashii]|uniref:Deacetylase sirtuin-type domain-containing protein n=1 Tax=[Candida] subhashii TaxID=561895 RepID=A0A8J5QUQ7_9ASCO|nr:uncharacterized protein J8A68_003784 [[Candida] subhashii]KAG7662725.1 hypothetical protein J8A68_003784 [[Candida] subhashii]
MHDLKKNHHGDQIGKKVGEHTDHAPRPSHDSVFRIEADSARRLSPSSSRNPMYVSSNQHSENTGNQIALPPPIPEQIRAANTLSKAPPGIDNTSNIFSVQSTSEEKSAEFAQKENHFMSSAAEIDLTRTKPLESGMVAPLTDISNIQSQTTKSISKENADTIDERVSELSSFSPRSEAEASSSEDGEYTAGSIEPLTDNSNFSQSIFLDRMEPDLELQSEYREHLEKEGPMSFLERYIPDTMNKFDICKMIINLGYPKESIDCQHLTINETIKVLIDLISKDLSQDSDSDMVIDVPSEDEDNYNIKDLLQDLRRSSRIVVITGAGISTSLGIPDFRSFQGLYTQLSRLNVEDPQKVFDMETFKKDPRIFYSIAHMVLPPDKNYSIMHAFLNLLQNKNKLLRNYTQNIDNLEARAGIEHKKLIQCHGSFTHATCITCLSQYSGRKIERHIRHQQIPRCARCWKNTGEAPMNHGVIKPDITFFGEDLPKRYYSTLSRDVRSCDLVLVVGTSLKVEPVASIIDKIPRRVPRILINKDAIPDKDFDLSLLGYCDEVVSYLAKELGDEWNIDHQLYDQETNFEVREDPNFESVYSISKKS